MNLHMAQNARSLRVGGILAIASAISILFCGLLGVAGDVDAASMTKREASPFSLKRLDSIVVRDFQVCGVSTPAFAYLLQRKLKEWDASGADGCIVAPAASGINIKRISGKADGVSMKDMLKSICKANSIYWWIEDGRLVISQESRRPDTQAEVVPNPELAVADKELSARMDSTILRHVDFEELPLCDALANLKTLAKDAPTGPFLLLKEWRFEIIDISSGAHLVTFSGEGMSFKDALSYVCKTSSAEWWLDGNIIFVSDAKKAK